MPYALSVVLIATLLLLLCCGHGYVQIQLTQFGGRDFTKNLGAQQFRECLQDSVAGYFVIHCPTYCLPQVTNQKDM